MWRRGVERGEICEKIDGEIVLDLIYGPTIFRLLAGHGSLNDSESEAMVEAVFGGLRRLDYKRPRKKAGSLAKRRNGQR